MDRANLLPVDADRQAAGSAGRGAIAAVGPSQRDAQDGRALRGFGHGELDGPGCGPALAPLTPHVLGSGWVVDPAEALVEGVLGGGVLPGVGGGVGDLLEEPVLAVVALADGVGDVVGEEVAVAQRPAPEPVVGAVALEELVAGAVRVADLPDLPAIADGLPVELAQVQRLARFHGDVGLGVLAEDAVGEGVQRVGAGADVGDGESAVLSAVGPELVVVAVVRPGDDVAVA